MSVRELSVTLLLISACLFVQSSAGNRRHPGKKLSCCTKVSTANISSDVMGDTYRVQPATSHCVKAVIFATQSGTVCVDPGAEWVQDLIADMMKV